MKQKLKDRLLGSVWFTEIQVFLLNTWYLVRREWVITFPFLVIYSVFDIIMSSILVRVAIRLAMKLKGLTYIGPDNIVSFLTFPGTILLFLVMSVLVCVLHIIQPLKNIAPPAGRQKCGTSVLYQILAVPSRNVLCLKKPDVTMYRPVHTFDSRRG